ncbi:[NiFe]-hydrogenase I apocytochrome b subunit [Syntrophus gentianae]|uniref:[NiFe]-hydrogenase I apocytochrome b subunit n=1 Tax=Syntrophus gentianae TaxID=43775 RepID=A0A1H7YHH0_9BACT|nr:Ni/Fe-hydrogenase, b-type cytochrome subunit [Syntrophus gentianae]SEM45383.1 [NiFe]-hydrogenase I apocytochrome b subunit [Syntrophus gentianae]
MENIVEKKHWSVAIRIHHWAMAIAIFVLIGTGFLIAEPCTILGGETSQKFFVGEVRFWHILFGVLLAFLFLWRIYLAFFSQFKADWKDFLAFTYIPYTIQQLKFYLLIDKNPPPHTGLYGPMQSLAYLGLLFMVFLIVITGFILMGAGYHAAGLTAIMATILKPVENLLGGLATVRTIHHILTWGFVLFIVVHIYMAFWYDAVLKEGTLSSMVTGNMFQKGKH